MHLELLPCDWLISNLCFQVIEQVYLIKWPVSVCVYIDVGLCFVLSTRCRYDTVVLRQIQVFLALFEPLDVP